MTGLSNHLRIFLALEPCEIRKSFNGLAALAEQMKPADLKDGGLFLLTNKRRNRFKALRLTAENEFLRAENLLLKQKLVDFSRRLFGKSSEQLDPYQLQFFSKGIPFRDWDLKYSRFRQ